MDSASICASSRRKSVFGRRQHLAPLKPTQVAYTLPMTEPSLSGQGKSVLNAVASVDLPVSHGASILGALGALSKLVEVDD